MVRVVGVECDLGTHNFSCLSRTTMVSNYYVLSIQPMNKFRLAGFRLSFTLRVFAMLWNFAKWSTSSWSHITLHQSSHHSVISKFHSQFSVVYIIWYEHEHVRFDGTRTKRSQHLLRRGMCSRHRIEDDLIQIFPPHCCREWRTQFTGRYTRIYYVYNAHFTLMSTVGREHLLPKITEITEVKNKFQCSTDDTPGRWRLLCKCRMFHIVR